MKEKFKDSLSTMARSSSSADPFRQEPLALPREIDIDADADSVVVQRLLAEHGSYEASGETARRETILKQLMELFNDFAHERAIAAGSTFGASWDSGVRVLPFGSQRLGVNGPGGDMDIVCIGPANLSRASFFEHMPSHLSRAEGVKDITCLIDAYVPLIKCKWLDISVDLLYACLPFTSIPETLHLRDSVLLGLDQKSVLSLNGARVTDTLASLVPHLDRFRLALRFIKIWAKKRGIYSNVLGYLGGVSWAILVAHVCRLVGPHASVSRILWSFFFLYSVWIWPTPVDLVVSPNELPGEAKKSPATTTTTTTTLAVWSVATGNSAFDVMPILTPVYPRSNSSYNVSASTLGRIQHEMKQTMEALARTRTVGETTTTPMSVWKSFLAQPTDFFKRYAHYLCVTTSAQSQHDLDRWMGWVESRIRHLVTAMETSGALLEICCLPIHFPLRTATATASSCTFIGITIPPATPSSPSSVPATTAPEQKKRHVELAHEMETFRKSVIEKYKGVPIIGTKVDVTHVRNADLPRHTVIPSAWLTS